MAEDKAIKTNKIASDHAAFVQSVKASLNTAKAKTSGLRQTDTQLLVANIVSPAAATLLAGFAAAIGGIKCSHRPPRKWKMAAGNLLALSLRYSALLQP